MRRGLWGMDFPYKKCVFFGSDSEHHLMLYVEDVSQDIVKIKQLATFSLKISFIVI